MTALDRLPLHVWLAVWRRLQCYHRYRVEGLEHLLDGRASLIVGYHGRPFAFDLCMLTVALYDRLGYLPHGIVHRGVDVLPPLRWLTDGLGFVTGDDDRLVDAVRRGEHIVVTPGGAREGCRAFWQRYRVRWDGALGYVRLALRHRLPIVPVAAAGVDDTYVGLTDADALGRWLGLPRDWTWLPWVGVGPLGLFPFSPPFPVRFVQRVGAPIDLTDGGPIDPTDRAALGRCHRRVQDAVQALLDAVRADAERSSS